MSTAICVPGDRLGLIVRELAALGWRIPQQSPSSNLLRFLPALQDQFEPGHGTHVRNGVIYASLCGTVSQQQKDASEQPSTSGVGTRKEAWGVCMVETNV
jgi:hypothetical protein